MCGVTFGSIAIKLAIALYALKILDNVVLAQTKGQALVPHKPGDTQRAVFVPPNSTCEPPRRNCDPNNKFYTFDGSCNNLDKTFWGQAGIVYERMFPANYADSKNKICVSAFDGSPLPPVRDVRRLLLSDMSVPDGVRNINFYAAGQHYTHDVTSFNSARLTSSCCTDDNKPVVPAPPGCIPILVRPDDPWYSQFGVRCLPMTRANCSYDAKCDMNKPSTPFNFVTGVFDMSMVYSNNKNICDTLRTMKGGRMKKWMNSHNQMFYPMTTACEGISSDCWVCGDQRVTACPELCLFTMMFFRLHDTMCSVLANVANYLNDQQTFDCARRLVIACSQVTLYQEYLPLHFGKEACIRHDLLPRRSRYTTYNSSMNPNTCVEFMVSRSVHNMVVSGVNYRATDGSMTFYRLKEKFLNMTFLMEGTTCPHLMQSYHVTSCNKADSHGIHDLDDCLFPDPGKPYGLDLISADLQRARDMGMPGYCALRRYLNMSPVKSFDDLRGIIDKPEDIPKLKQLYKCVEDIDALVMIQREARSDPVATLGPVGVEILCRAYKAYKFGDRFYFEHGPGPTAFCPEALDMIRGIRLCHIICWANPTISNMLVPENGYCVPSENNKMKSCAQWIRSGPNLAHLARLIAEQAYPQKSAPPGENRP